MKTKLILLGLLATGSLILAAAGEPSPGDVPEPKPKPQPAAEKAPSEISPELKAALARLKLPGVKIDLEKWCVDVESAVCLLDGALELIACTKDTKEHESIVVVEAKPSHIHTALLLLGAKPGNPAMRKIIDEENMRWIDLPPRGGPVEVYLVIKDSEGKLTERPISEFLEPSEGHDGIGGGGLDKDAKFPTHTFLFAGSILHGEGEGPRKYLADMSGHVITTATFGDELLCLPGIHGHANGMLLWQVKGDELPGIGDKVTLRLRPQMKPRADAKSGG